MKFFRSISNQLSFIIFASFFVMVITFLIGYYIYSVSLNEKNFKEDINRRVEYLSISISENLWNIDEASIERLLELFHSSKDVVSIGIKSDDFTFSCPIKEGEENKTNQIRIEKPIFHEKNKFSKAPKSQIGVVKVVFTNHFITDKFNSLFLTIFIILLLVVLSVSVVIRFSVNYILRKSFDAFAHGFRKIANRDYEYIATMRKKGKIKYEFIPLLYNLNRMSNDIKSQMLKKENVEKELIKAKNEAIEANDTKDDFLSNVTHEMKTPLHAILSYTRFGISKIEKVDKEKLLYYFEQIKSSGETLEKFQNDILDISKHQANMTNYKMEEVEIIKPIKSVLQELSSLFNDKLIDVSIQNNLEILDEDNLDNRAIFSSAKIDEFKIGQVLRNIISNAIRYSKANTKIRIILDRASHLTGQRASDSTIIDGVSIQIIDEGIGIPERELETIFDKFYQSTITNSGSGGTGLGLAISKEIIIAHRGKIWAENNINGIGSSFFIEIPLSLKKFKESFIED